MKIKSKKVEFIIGLFLSILVLFLISLLIFSILYDFKWENQYISNALFIPNILIFFFSLGVNLGAGNIFNPLRYAIKKIFTPRRTLEAEPMTYADYVEAKKKDVKNFWYITIATVIWLIVALVFALV